LKRGRVLLSSVMEENSLPIQMFLADVARRLADPGARNAGS